MGNRHNFNNKRPRWLGLVCQKTSKLEDHNSECKMELKCQNAAVVFFSIWVSFRRHWRFTGQQENGCDHLNSSLSFSPAHKHSDIYLQLYIWEDNFLFLIALLVTTILLQDNIIPPPDFMSDFVTAYPHRQAVDLISHRLSTYYYRGNEWPVELVIPLSLTFISENTGKFR